MHYSIELMEKEHADINRMLKVMQQYSIRIMHGEEIDQEDFKGIIDFVRNYADKHHHGKEEKSLFPLMVERLGKLADNLIPHGMLVEHELGRSHVRALEEALKVYKETPTDEIRLDIITEAMGYAHLLSLHTEKENSVVYPFAERMLSEEDFAKVDAYCRRFEAEEDTKGVQKKYLSFLEEMEKKYIQ